MKSTANETAIELAHADRPAIQLKPRPVTAARDEVADWVTLTRRLSPGANFHCD